MPATSTWSKSAKESGNSASRGTSAPPFVPGDEAFYKVVVLPAVTRLIQEYTEKIGRALVVTW